MSINILWHNSKETMSTMIRYIKETFKDRISELGEDWLDDLSLKRSLEKVDAITEMVGYPDRILENSYVNGLSASVS